VRRIIQQSYAVIAAVAKCRKAMREVEAWVIAGMGNKIGSLTKRVAGRGPEIKDAFMALMKTGRR
jgi:hypothetical protein